MFVPEAPAKAPGAEEPEVPIAELADELTKLASHIAAGTCRWLELLGEFDARAGWTEWQGVRSCSDWVSWQCSLDSRSAREHVRVARTLRELPRTRKAFRAGKLSFSKVRALTRVADPDSEAELLRLAEHATAAQLERMLGAYRRVTDAQADKAQRERRVSHAFDDDGSVRLWAKLPPEEGAIVLAALDRAQAELCAAADAETPDTESLENGSAEPAEVRPEEWTATRADALVAIAEATLAGGMAPVPGGGRHELVIHADLNALSPGSDGTIHTENGAVLAPTTARRLGCDAALVTSLERDGNVLSVGRRTRAVPAATRRALTIRDRGCRFPGCNNRRWVDAHHIHHWADGGETSLENLVLLCRRHHRLLHEGGYTIERGAEGEFSFRHPGGWTIPFSPSPPEGEQAALPAGDGLLAGSGERMDLGACVGAVFEALAQGP